MLAQRAQVRLSGWLVFLVCLVLPDGSTNQIDEMNQPSLDARSGDYASPLAEN
ncbi:MAG: hypothetical protein L0H94_16125 [Nitrospira sp.]|nr:hypothetical protein [Nitrospira sp.]